MTTRSSGHRVIERKPPRRTRQRILDTALQLFNDFGEPNVNTTIIAERIQISPGNLYYHFKNKDDIVVCVFQQFERDIGQLLDAPPRDPHIEDAWLFLHLLFELIWTYRFLYRDLNNLLINNRTLEVRFKVLLERKVEVARQLCAGLQRAGQLAAGIDEIDALATNMVVLATYWLSYAYACDPRHFDDAAVINAALSRGCYQVMILLAPFLIGAARAHLEKLAGEYRNA